MPAGWRNVSRRITAIVIFQHSDGRAVAPWDVFCGAAWRHCWAIMPACWPEEGAMSRVYSIKVEPLQWGLDVAVWWEHPRVVAQAFLDQGITAALEFDVTLPPGKAPFIWRGPISCVTVVKAALGIRAWWVWTPRQLFGYLLRHGARFIPYRGASDGTADTQSGVASRS